MSYELVGASGLGTPSSNGSLFGLGAIADPVAICGAANPRAGEPAGLSAAYRASYPRPGLNAYGKPLPLVCAASGAGGGPVLQKLCNLSNNPTYCMIAKLTTKPFMGRGTANDAQLWVNWDPSQNASQGATMPPPPGGGGGPTTVVASSDNTYLYAGIGVVVVALGAVAWKMSKKHS